MPIDNDLWLSCALFGVFVCGISIFTRSSNLRTSLSSESPAFKPLLKGQAYHLACALEDAPTNALTGQAYELATPLMTPLACILTHNWHQIYQQQLGKPGIHYWEWQDKPEASNTCLELTRLLELPEPTGAAREVLESLAERNYPFLKWVSPVAEPGTRSSHLRIALESVTVSGKFAHLDFQVQKQMRQDFKRWHEDAKQQIGGEALSAIYRVCYRTSWETVQQIVTEPANSLETILLDASLPWWVILGVSPTANPIQVEKSYKKLMRIWHPDINKHPDATQITSRINVAYEHYQASHPPSAIADRSDRQNQADVLSKFRDWLKPFFRIN